MEEESIINLALGKVYYLLLMLKINQKINQKRIQKRIQNRIQKRITYKLTLIPINFSRNYPIIINLKHLRLSIMSTMKKMIFLKENSLGLIKLLKLRIISKGFMEKM